MGNNRPYSLDIQIILCHSATLLEHLFVFARTNLVTIPMLAKLSISLPNQHLSRENRFIGAMYAIKL